MAEQAKKKGRPKGTGIDDAGALRSMAALMVKAPKLRATAAYKLVNAKWEERDLRRIQIKWKANGERLLAEARAPKASPARVSVADREITAIRTASQAAREAAELRGLSAAHRSTLRAVDDYMKSPALRKARELYDTAAMRAERELFNSPSMQTAREIYNSPEMRLIREMQNSPEMRLARELRRQREWRDLLG